MRMWMINPKCMCRQHLLGEHVECHMFLGTLKKKKHIDGYLMGNLFEPLSLKKRHDELEEEMVNRGYRTNSKMNDQEVTKSLEYLEEEPDVFLNYKIKKDLARVELLSRCSECRNLYEVNNEKT